MLTLTDAVVEGPDGAVPVRWYRPACPVAPTLLWLHGGGFFRGDLDQPESDAVATALAERGVPVVAVGYRLGPVPGMPWVGRSGTRARRPAPAAHDEVVHVYRSVAERAARGVVLGGASAGACLAAAVTGTLTSTGLDIPAPVGTVLAYGFFHARLPRDAGVLRSVRGHRRLTHAPWALDAANRAYAGTERMRTDRRAFPGGHPVDGFPPTLLVDADLDAMRGSGEQFAAELTAASVPVDRHVLPRSRHAFLNRPGTPDFTTAVDHIATWTAAR
ncbi:alpha/beta hydrolase [Microbacterium sp. M1A1_1b]